MDEELFEVAVEAALPLQALIAMIVGGLVASLPESWLVPRSQFTTLNLSDNTTSPVDHCKRTSAFLSSIWRNTGRRSLSGAKNALPGGDPPQSAPESPGQSTRPALADNSAFQTP